MARTIRHMWRETDTGHFGVHLRWPWAGKNHVESGPGADSSRECDCLGPLGAIRWLRNFLSSRVAGMDRSGRAPARVCVPASYRYQGFEIRSARAVCGDDVSLSERAKWAAILRLLGNRGRSGQFARTYGARTVCRVKLAHAAFGEMAAPSVWRNGDSELPCFGGFFSHGKEAGYRYFYSGRGKSAGFPATQGTVWIRESGRARIQLEAA